MFRGAKVQANSPWEQVLLTVQHSTQVSDIALTYRPFQKQVVLLDAMVGPLPRPLEGFEELMTREVPVLDMLGIYNTPLFVQFLEHGELASSLFSGSAVPVTGRILYVG